MKLLDALMVATIAGATLLLATADASFGQDRLVVPLPDVSGLSRDQAQALTVRVVEADIIGSNCGDYAITDGEWTLLTGTGELLAEKLELDPVGFEREFRAPAYELLDDPGACERLGPKVAPLIAQLVGMGGATRPQAAEAD
ncbi:hypothetical protein [Paracoccus seriniphilus]|uniref:Uncharacterized protein n=1 Tax=Paracoccus seriniphilus TaxID=184748 RepID=A0A239Q247_9RHOB|nr:hypothetical protein [Paracoccus seriniphilus]SNT76027.1 hypothetical protein SAMN05444959_11479 [Paracoccus seriniphilus]